MSKPLRTILLLGTALLSSCTLGPDYERPKTEIPAGWEIGTEAKDAPLSKSWWQAFSDPTLTAMIQEAMTANDDIAVAAGRVTEARALLDLAEANRLPAINIDAAATRTKISRESVGSLGAAGTAGGVSTGGGAAASFFPGIRNQYTLAGLLSFDLDLWGRLRRADEAATAQLLSTEAARDSVRLNVLTTVAATYFNMLSLDQQIRVTDETIASREASLALFQKRFEAETISALDFRQAESELAIAREQLPLLRQQLTEQENALSILLGKSPRQIIEEVPTRGAILPELPVPPGLPESLTTEILDRRPDIRSAEQQLVSANAEIGFARAAFFPQLTLNALYGRSSLEFDRLFKDTAEQWNIGGELLGPLIDFGRTSANVEAAEARKTQALANYRKTVRTAFAEVVNTRNAQANTEARLQAAAERNMALSEYLRLANLRYDAGYSDFLEVLDAQRSLFSAQLDLVGSQRDRLIAVLDLYRALGGGWSDSPPLADTGADGPVETVPQDMEAPAPAGGQEAADAVSDQAEEPVPFSVQEAPATSAPAR